MDKGLWDYTEHNNATGLWEGYKRHTSSYLLYEVLGPLAAVVPSMA